MRSNFFLTVVRNSYSSERLSCEKSVELVVTHHHSRVGITLCCFNAGYITRGCNKKVDVIYVRDLGILDHII